MSAETLQAIEDAIVAHLRDITDAELKPERASAVVTSWLVAFEISNIVEIETEGGNMAVIGYANDYATSDGSPNTHVSLARWASDEISYAINGADDEDDR